jgi:nitronate monooxygenase
LAVNVMLRRDPSVVAAELASIVRHRVPIVIASVGSPRGIVEPLHEAGTIVLADVGSMRHVHGALAAHVDGLVLLSAGAGGQTGWLNGLAFVRAVRASYDGLLVLAGGVSDGRALLASEVVGCDLAYMGTRFIATVESGAEAAYRNALVAATMDDVVLTTQATGIAANFLSARFDGVRPGAAPHGFSAGHTVGAVTDTNTAASVIQAVAAEYRQARAETLDRLRAVSPAAVPGSLQG